MFVDVMYVRLEVRTAKVSEYATLPFMTNAYFKVTVLLCLFFFIVYIFI